LDKHLTTGRFMRIADLSSFFRVARFATCAEDLISA